MGRYEVQSPQLALYRHGPAQGTGPDVSLSRGDQVTVLESAHGFSRVTTASGETGYVNSGCLRPVPPAVVVSAGARGEIAKAAGSQRNKSSVRPALSSEPLFDVGDLPASEAMTAGTAQVVAVPRFRAPR